MRIKKVVGCVLILSLLCSCDDLSSSTTSLDNYTNVSYKENVENQIFISELYQGNDGVFDIVLEIANTTNYSINLNNYKINIYNLNNLINSISLVGSLNSNQTYLISNPNISIEGISFDLVLSETLLLKNRCYEIVNLTSNEIIDVYNSRAYTSEAFNYGNPLRNENSLFSITQFDYLNYYCITKGNSKYLGNLNTPTTYEEFKKGPHLEEQYQDLPFATDSQGGGGGFVSVSVSSLGDGDTTVFNYPSSSNLSSTSNRTRYLLIDTPEIDHGSGSSIVAEPWGEAAKTYNNNILNNATNIIVQSNLNQSLHDTYGRVFGYVWYTNVSNPSLDDYRLLNFEILRDSLAKQSSSSGYVMESNDMYYSFYTDYFYRIAQKEGKKIHGEKDPDFNYN